MLSRIVCTSVRYSCVSHPRADTASGISHSGSHCMAPFGHYSMTFSNCLSARFFLKYILSFRSPIVRSSLFIRTNGIRHTVNLRFLQCKGIAVLTDSKQRSVTRYRRRYFSADFRNKLGIEAFIDTYIKEASMDNLVCC